MSNMDKGQTTLLLGASIAALVVGYGLGALITGESRWQAGLKAGAEQKQEEMAKILTDSGLLPPELPINDLPGKIVSVNGNTLTIEVENLNTNPFSSPSPSIRTVTVAPNASIIKLAEKTPEKFDKEQAAFFEAEEKFVNDLSSGIEATPPEPPSPYDREEINLSDLNPGMFVQVNSAEDVREAKAVTAVSLTVRDTQFSTFERLPEPEPVEPPLEETPDQPEEVIE